MMASLTLKYLAIVQGDLVEDLIGHKILPGLVSTHSDLTKFSSNFVIT